MLEDFICLSVPYLPSQCCVTRKGENANVFTQQGTMQILLSTQDKYFLLLGKFKNQKPEW